MTRKTYTAEYKTKLVLEAIREESRLEDPVNLICLHNQVDRVIRLTGSLFSAKPDLFSVPQRSLQGFLPSDLFFPGFYPISEYLRAPLLRHIHVQLSIGDDEVLTGVDVSEYVLTGHPEVVHGVGAV